MCHGCGLAGRNSRNTFVTAGMSPAVVRIGWSQLSVHYGDEYYFSLFGRHALTSPEGGRPCSLSCWPSGFPNNAMRITLNLVISTRTVTVQERVYFIYKESVEVPGMGPGESYKGVLGKVRTARWLLVKKDPEERPGLYLKGPTGDVMLRHYGARGICWIFGDVVYVTVPVTTVCISKRRYQSRAL